MALSYGTHIPKDNLSLYLDPANPKCYSGSGSVLNDLSGNDNTVTISGAPTISGGYFTFDGTDDHFTITNNQDSLDFSNEQTIIIWMKHSYTSGRKNPYDQAYGGYGTWTHEQGNNINYYYGDGGGNAQPYTARNSSTTIRNQWNMMVTTRDTSNIKWYNNASLINTGSNPYGTLTTTNANIRIGVGYAGRWIGQMGPILLYKRALTAEEVARIYQSMKGRHQ